MINPKPQCWELNLTPAPRAVLPSSPSRVVVPPSAQFSNQSPRSSFIFPHPASTQPVLLPAITRFVPFSFPCIVLASHSQMLLSPLHLCPSSPSHLPARLSPLHPPLPLRSVLPQKPQRPLTLIAPKMQCGPTKFPRKLNSLLCLGIPVYSVPELPSLLAMVSQKLSSLGSPRALFFKLLPRTRLPSSGILQVLFPLPQKWFSSPLPSYFVHIL